MSHTTVYEIMSDGTVASFGEASNSSAWCMHVWMTLDRRYGLGCSERGTGTYEPLWSRCGKSPLTVEESLVLAATFDTPWVKRENIPLLIMALYGFWKAHKFVRDRMGGEAHEVSPTIVEVASLLSQIHFDPTALGAAIWGTSSARDPWGVDNDDDEEESERRFVFGKDTSTRCGTPIEVVEYTQVQAALFQKTSAWYVAEFIRGRTDLEARCRKLANDVWKAPEIIPGLLAEEFEDACQKVTDEERAGLDRIRGNGDVLWNDVMLCFRVPVEGRTTNVG